MSRYYRGGRKEGNPEHVYAWTRGIHQRSASRNSTDRYCAQSDSPRTTTRHCLRRQCHAAKIDGLLSESAVRFDDVCNGINHIPLLAEEGAKREPDRAKPR